MKRLLARLGIVDPASIWAVAKQFIKFGIVGFSNTLIAMAIYYSLVLLDVNYLIANFFAFAISVLNAFYWNRKYVFKGSTKSKLRQLTKVYSSYGITFLISMGSLFLMVDVLCISELIAPIINLCITVPLNFLLNKFWAFR